MKHEHQINQLTNCHTVEEICQAWVQMAGCSTRWPIKSKTPMSGWYLQSCMQQDRYIQFIQTKLLTVKIGFYMYHSYRKNKSGSIFLVTVCLFFSYSGVGSTWRVSEPWPRHWRFCEAMEEVCRTWDSGEREVSTGMEKQKRTSETVHDASIASRSHDLRCQVGTTYKTACL